MRRGFVGSAGWRAAVAAALLIGLTACAGDRSDVSSRGSALEAQAMVARAIASYASDGEAAFADMTAPSDEFVDRDLYIFVVGPDGTVVAHGADATRIGVDVATLTDVDGFAYGQAILDSATPEGVWLDYKREDPISGAIEPKSSWLRLYDGYVFGCGIYRP